MKRLFKPRIGIFVQDIATEYDKFPDYIKDNFDIKVANFMIKNDFSHYMFDSEIMITELGSFQPNPYQLHLSILNFTELEQELIWQFVYDSWYGINDNENTKYDEYQDLKKGVAVLINNGHIAKAGEIIAILKDIIQYDEEWLSYLAMIQYLENNVESAIFVLRQAYFLSPNNQDTLYNLGFMYKVNGEIRQSIYYFERLLKVTTNKRYIDEANEMLTECYHYI
ncbi:tetratricopeptide repeat protein [Paenibacillus typhae]|uniref:tetratricopeptide repeat protein n=1 Tax=Paenibacillus typhae TaxID=1174501 RepID=UPI001C8E922D|nr:hypothetical protein [Paenibacillus typhae]MBY0009106.1 hypothetical protein [Paenibacillus typhae]